MDFSTNILSERDLFFQSKIGGFWASKDEMEKMWEKKADLKDRLSSAPQSDTLKIQDHEDFHTNKLISQLKKERSARTSEDISNIKNRIFAFPHVKQLFGELGVEHKYVNELMELFDYQYVEEGDEFITPGNSQDYYYIVLDGVVSFYIDLMSPEMAVEANVVKVAQELDVNPGELVVRLKDYRQKNCLTNEELRERKVKDMLRQRLKKLFIRGSKIVKKRKEKQAMMRPNDILTLAYEPKDKQRESIQNSDVQSPTLSPELKIK